MSKRVQEFLKKHRAKRDRLRKKTKQGEPDREAYSQELRARTASESEKARSMMSASDSSQESSQKQKPTQ